MRRKWSFWAIIVILVLLTSCRKVGNSNLVETTDISSLGETYEVIYTLPATAEDEDLTVTLLLEDNTEIECLIESLFQAGDYWYIALFSPPELGDDIYLYRYTIGDDGEIELGNIDTDSEYNYVADIYEEMHRGN